MVSACVKICNGGYKETCKYWRAECDDDSPTVLIDGWDGGGYIGVDVFLCKNEEAICEN